MELASIFTDNLVLQQGIRVPIWGTATPGEIVAVRFAGQVVFGVADVARRWTAYLNPLIASSEPSILEVIGPGGKGCRLTNVLVGEVWVCSGQSNMEWPLAESNNSDEEIRSIDHPCIRLFSVPKQPSAKRREKMQGASWRICSPETIARFSAVAYFFGRELQQRLQVPVGLIDSSVGGTFAESWTSREGLLAREEFRSLVTKFEHDLPLLETRKSEWEREMDALENRTRDRENTKFAEGWAGLDEPSGVWADMELPGAWQWRGLNHSGILWFRKAVELSGNWAGRDLRLSIGAVDKSDTTYFNNEKIGGITMADREDAWSLARNYVVPGRLVKPGRNVISVRVHSDKYAGGMTGPAQLMQVSCPAAGGADLIPLAGTWRYAVEANYGLVQLPDELILADHRNAPSALFNGMIAPLLPYAIRGVIWYQGEANADYALREFIWHDGKSNPANRAKEYEVLFPTLIRDWRRAWGQGDFTFLFVQLANFRARSNEPSESKWAELREAQRKTLALPNTGMAVTIDIGDEEDVHPRNKKDVGLRLAFSALHQIYGFRDIAPSGPVFRTITRDGACLRCFFDPVRGELVCDGRELRGFVIAGEDGRFVRAEAKLEGGQVVLRSPQVSVPVAARYAWADNPDASLFNSAGLPASPFQAVYGC